MSGDAYTTFRDGLFAGRTVMITGAASGMGLETSRAFALKGAEVVMCDKDRVALTRHAEEISSTGGTVHALPMDVSEQESIDAGFAWCDENLGSVDNLVTSAAIITAKRLHEQDWSHWRKVNDVNLLGTFFCVQAAAKRMLENGKGGNIVCIGSDAGIRGGGGLIADTAYAASKAGTLSIVKSVARELAGRNVRINALVPGPTDSPMHAHIDQSVKDRIAASLPRGRMGRPDDMASAVLFLCSDAAAFIYGAALDVDGGSMFR